MHPGPSLLVSNVCIAYSRDVVVSGPRISASVDLRQGIIKLSTLFNQMKGCTQNCMHPTEAILFGSIGFNVVCKVQKDFASFAFLLLVVQSSRRLRVESAKMST